MTEPRKQFVQMPKHFGSFINDMFPTLHADLQHGLHEMERIMIIEEQTDELIIRREKNTVKAAIDSGAAKHATHPTTRPSNVSITPNTTG